MDPKTIEHARDTAVFAAREAGRMLREGFGKPYWVREKSLGETVTELDLKAEKAILSIIKREYPDHGVLAEESGRVEKGEWLWVVDPLDGSTNFSIKNPFFCTSIALGFRGEIVLGVTLAPMTGELFYATKGGGCYLNDERIRVSREPEMSRLLLSYCNGKSQADKAEISRIFSKAKASARDFDRYKAGALELAFVATGRLGCYLANSQMAWDSAAGALMVREAGGRVTDFSGQPWTLSSKDILASNGLIHEQLLKIIKETRNSN